MAFTPKGFEQITSLSSATGLTVPTGAQYAIIQAEGQDIRWRDDGTAPTASVGMIIAVGKSERYAGDLNAVQLIEEAASATANITYYG